MLVSTGSHVIKTITAAITKAVSLLGIMSLGVVTGSTVTLSAYGSDAEAAVAALEALLQRDVY